MTPYRCNNCGLWLSEQAFEEKYRHAACLRTRACKSCELRRQCKECEKWKSEKEFLKSEWEHAQWPSSERGCCKECTNKKKEAKNEMIPKQCNGPCKEFKTENFYSPNQWRLSDSARKCLKCGGSKKRGYWICADVECKQEKCIDSFSLWLKDRTHRKNDGTARCNECFQKRDNERNESLRADLSNVIRMT